MASDENSTRNRRRTGNRSKLKVSRAMHDISDYGPFKSRLLVGKMWFLVDANRWLVVAVVATPSVLSRPVPDDQS